MFGRDHIKEVHRRPQCTRCWKTFKEEEDWQAHINEEPRVDCPDQRNDIYKIESVTAAMWEGIQRILSTPRGAQAKASMITEEEKWFAVKNIIFPVTQYPEFIPKHPCKCYSFLEFSSLFD